MNFPFYQRLNGIRNMFYFTELADETVLKQGSHFICFSDGSYKNTIEDTRKNFSPNFTIIADRNMFRIFNRRKL